MTPRHRVVGPSLHDLALGMLRCGWSMAVLGVERTADVAAGRGVGRRDAAIYDEAAYRAERSMTEDYRAIYRAGDRLGRSLLDLFFGRGGPLDPRRVARGAADAACRAADLLDDALPRAPRPRYARSGTRPDGWRPPARPFEDERP